MLVKCPKCGAHVPPEVAVETKIDDHVEQFCSVRCATAAETEAARNPSLPPLPELPKRIVVAVDGSGPSLRATEYAVALARATGGSITLVHAIDPSWLRWLPGGSALPGAERLGLKKDKLESGIREDAEAQLDRCRRVCEAGGVQVTWRIEVAAPVLAIAHAAAEADLIVMGSRGLGAVSGAAVGSLSHRLIAETRKPVLLVH